MTAAGRRTGFALLIAALAILLFFFSTTYLFWILLILLVLTAADAYLIRTDARRLELTAKASPGAQVGRSARITLSALRHGPLLAAGSVVVEMEICNLMFGTTRRQQFTLPLQSREKPLETSLDMDLCGETALRCVQAKVWDPMGLFCVDCTPFPESRTVCYPQQIGLELMLSRDTAGNANTEGLMQNRRGSDPSETFDIREYVPGDDVRAIHWKLSCKTDTLTLREPSEPSHYDVVLLPDLGLTQLSEDTTASERNSAAALTVELGEQLLMQGISFCFAIPSRQGLRLCEVTDRRALHRLLPQWLGLEIPAQSGVGLKFFLSEHYEQYFTRLLILSAGKYTQDIGGLEKRIGITVISTADDVSSPVYTRLGAGCEAIVLPSAQAHGERYKIVC